MLMFTYSFKKSIIVKLLVLSLVHIIVINNTAYGINARDLSCLRKPLEAVSDTDFLVRFNDSANEIRLSNNPSKIIEVLREVPEVNGKLKALFMNLREYRPLDKIRQKAILSQLVDINNMAVTYQKAKEKSKKAASEDTITNWQRFKDLFKFEKENEEGLNIRYSKKPYYRESATWWMDLSLILTAAIYFSEVFFTEHKLTIVHYLYTETVLQWLYNAWGVLSATMLGLGVGDGIIKALLLMLNKNSKETENGEVINISKILISPSEGEAVGKDYPKYSPEFCGTKKIQKQDISMKINALKANVNAYDGERVGAILDEIKDWELAEPELIFDVARKIEDIFKLSDTFQKTKDDNNIKAANLVFDLTCRAVIIPAIENYNNKGRTKYILEGIETISNIYHPEAARYLSFIAKNASKEKLRLSAAGFLAQRPPREFFTYQHILETALNSIDGDVRDAEVKYLIADLGFGIDYSLVYSLYLWQRILDHNNAMHSGLDKVIDALKGQINLYGEEVTLGGIICRNNGFMEYFIKRLEDPEWRGSDYDALDEEFEYSKYRPLIGKGGKISASLDVNIISCGKYRYILKKTIDVFDSELFRDRILKKMLSGNEGEMLEGIKDIYQLYCRYSKVNPIMTPVMFAMLEWVLGVDDLYKDLNLEENINVFLYPNAVKLADIAYNNMLNDKKDEDGFLKEYERILKSFKMYEKIRKTPDTLYSFLYLNGYQEIIKNIEDNIDLLSEAGKEQLIKWRDMTFSDFMKTTVNMLKQAHPDKPINQLSSKDTEPLVSILKKLRHIRDKL